MNTVDNGGKVEAKRAASVETRRLSFLVLKREGQESRVT